jgi:enhancing lycopene biosynthesis protein 2
MPERFSPEPLRTQVGMLLSGCGRFDGTDVQEAVLCALALDRRGARVVPLAPRRSQLHVVDHTIGDEMDAGPRDILLESARMLHDKIHPIPEFPLETLQALVVPGGFGGAKNLMSGFARLGERRAAQADAAQVVRHFLDGHKPVGVVGMGDILVRHFTGQGLEDPRAELDPAGLEIDRERRIVSTPGFKSFRRVSEVAVGIDAMVGELMRWVGQS